MFWITTKNLKSCEFQLNELKWFADLFYNVCVKYKNMTQRPGLVLFDLPVYLYHYIFWNKYFSFLHSSPQMKILKRAEEGGKKGVLFCFYFLSLILNLENNVKEKVQNSFTNSACLRASAFWQFKVFWLTDENNYFFTEGDTIEKFPLSSNYTMKREASPIHQPLIPHWISISAKGWIYFS